MSKKWTAVQYDLTKSLTAEATNKRVTIPANQKLELIVDLEDAVYNKLSKDPTWLQLMQTKANSKVTPVLDKVKAKVKDADQKAAKFDAKTADIFTKDINSYISQEMGKAAKEMATEVDKAFDEYKKGKSDLTTFRIKSAGKITINAISIVAAAAVAGATHAVLAPPAIVAIVRASIVIGQECVKLALDADKFALLINAELKVLVKWMQDSKVKAETKLKLMKEGKSEKDAKAEAQLEALKQGNYKPGKEFALSAISGVLGVETPSITNLESHVGVHKVDITKLEKSSHELSPHIYDAMDREEKWRKKLQENEKTLPAAKVTKLKEKCATAEKVLQKMVEAVEKINEAVERAKKRQEAYEKTVTAMKEGNPAWLQYVTPIVGAAVDIGISVSGGGSALSQCLGVLGTVESDTAQALLG